MSGWERVGSIFRWRGGPFPEPSKEELAEYPIDVEIYHQYVPHDLRPKGGTP